MGFDVFELTSAPTRVFELLLEVSLLLTNLVLLGYAVGVCLVFAGILGDVFLTVWQSMWRHRMGALGSVRLCLVRLNILLLS